MERNLQSCTMYVPSGMCVAMLSAEEFATVFAQSFEKILSPTRGNGIDKRHFDKFFLWCDII